MKRGLPMHRPSPRTILLIIPAMILSACTVLLSPEKSIPRSHPEKLPAVRPLCSDCHEGNISVSMKPYASLNHTERFVKDHRWVGAREERVCSLCHPRAFCSDCHGGKGEIRPSVLHGDRPDRELIHRGDYMTRHKIEGKLDPAGCSRCHGRTNNALCQSCHR